MSRQDLQKAIFLAKNFYSRSSIITFNLDTIFHRNGEGKIPLISLGLFLVKNFAIRELFTINIEIFLHFLGKFASKIQHCLFKIKFGT